MIFFEDKIENHFDVFITLENEKFFGRSINFGFVTIPLMKKQRG